MISCSHLTSGFKFARKLGPGLGAVVVLAAVGIPARANMFRIADLTRKSADSTSSITTLRELALTRSVLTDGVSNQDFSHVNRDSLFLAFDGVANEQEDLRLPFQPASAEHSGLVPEPASLFLLATAIVGLGATLSWRQMKIRKAAIQPATSRE